jgi:hypothetical protein
MVPGTVRDRVRAREIEVDISGHLGRSAPSAWSVCLSVRGTRQRAGGSHADLAAISRRGGVGQGKAVRPCRRQPRRGDLDRSRRDATITASPHTTYTISPTGGAGVQSC